MNKEKAIWLFAGGQMQESAAKKIVELGYKLILTDHNPQCLCARYADEFVACDTFDVDGNQFAAQELSEKYEICGVLTLAADCHETVARISRQLNLHGLSPEISQKCRQKNITREILTVAGIPQPRFVCVNNLTDAKVFLSSLGGLGVIKATDNSASRGGIKQLSRTLAVELAPMNITVNCIGPGRFNSTMTADIFKDEIKRKKFLDVIPMGRAGSPEDLAGVSVFLASDASSYITGQSIYVDGGWLAGCGNILG